LIDIVEKIVRSAGEILRSHYGKLQHTHVDEKSAHDYVTIADKASESFIIDKLTDAFPEIGILAEESGEAINNHTSYWIIDPLDGTKNFIQSIPYFAISIGLMTNNELTFGIVYHPMMDECFYAEKGKGAFLNGVPISISPLSDFSRGFISTGFPFKKRELSRAYFSAFEDIFSQITNVRRCGAAALDLAYTAAGRYDGFWELGLSPWDMAAGALLIKEAGGIVTDFNGNDDYLNSGNIIAGNSIIHSKLHQTIYTHFEGLANDK